jgi:hypothetical protein
MYTPAWLYVAVYFRTLPEWPNPSAIGIYLDHVSTNVNSSVVQVDAFKLELWERRKVGSKTESLIDATGIQSLYLFHTDSIYPKAYYEVYFDVTEPDQMSWMELWQVPGSLNTLNVAQLRMLSPEKRPVF